MYGEGVLCGSFVLGFLAGLATGVVVHLNVRVLDRRSGKPAPQPERPGPHPCPCPPPQHSPHYTVDRAPPLTQWDP